MSSPADAGWPNTAIGRYRGFPATSACSPARCPPNPPRVPGREQPPVCFPPTASWEEFWLSLRGPLPLVHRARQGHGDGVAGGGGEKMRAAAGDEVLVKGRHLGDRA